MLRLAEQIYHEKHFYHVMPGKLCVSHMAAGAMQLALLTASIQKSTCQHYSFFPAPHPSWEPLHQSEKWGFLSDESLAVSYINLQ